jgi:hypothetical protein
MYDVIFIDVGLVFKPSDERKLKANILSYNISLRYWCFKFTFDNSGNEFLDKY